MEGQEEDIGPEDSISDLCRKLYTAHTTAIAQSMALIRADTITRAAELLWNADKVYCMGQGGSMILAHEAAHLFSTVSNHFFFVQDSHIQASTAALLTPPPGTPSSSSPYSGSTKDIVELMGLAGSGGQDHPDHPVFQIPRGGPGRSGAPVRLQRGPLPAQQRARQDGPALSGGRALQRVHPAASGDRPGQPGAHRRGPGGKASVISLCSGGIFSSHEAGLPCFDKCLTLTIYFGGSSAGEWTLWGSVCSGPPLCLPVVTIGPATAPLLYGGKVFRHKEEGAFGMYWRAFCAEPAPGYSRHPHRPARPDGVHLRLRLS